MCRQFFLFLAIAPFAASAAPLTIAKEVSVDQTEAQEIIEQAIAAQGGKEQVGKLLTKPWRAGVKGTAGPLEITGTLSHHGPEKGRTVMKLGPEGKKIEVVVVHDGEHVWRSINGKTQEITGPELEEMKDGTWRSRKVRFLLPLLTDDGIELTMLGETKVADRLAIGVRVKSKGHRDVDVHFDKESGLLAKMESRIKSPDAREIVLEQVFSDYKEFDGLKLATKFTKFENGRQTSVEQFTDLEFVDQLDAKELAKP